MNTGISNINTGVSTINTEVSTINTGISAINSAMNAINGITTTPIINNTITTDNEVNNTNRTDNEVNNTNNDSSKNGVENETNIIKDETSNINNNTESANGVINENANKNDKQFDIDSNINSGLYTIIVIIAFIMVFMFLLILLNSVVNYAIFQYYNINKMILESDAYNLEKIKLKDTFEYRLVDYIYCTKSKENIDTDKDNNDEKKQFSLNLCNFSKDTNTDDAINLIKKLLKGDKCDIEPYWNIYGENKFHTLCIRLLYLVIIVLLIGSTIYIIINVFLTIRQWNITGSNLISYFFKNGELYAYTIILVFLFCIVHSILFKYLFIDNIYNNLYKNYSELIKLDAYVHNEMKNIETEKIFLNLLSNSTVFNIDLSYELNTHNQKIIQNIKDSTNNDVRASKIFLYAIYIFFKRQDPENIETIKIITDIATQNPENMQTLRSLLLAVIDNKTLSSQLNNITSTILQKLELADEYEIFNFMNYSELESTSLNYKIAYKINTFYEIITRIDDKLDLKRSIWEFNMYFIIMIIKSLAFMLLLFMILYFYSNKDPHIQKVVSWVISFLEAMLDEFKWTTIM